MMLENESVWLSRRLRSMSPDVLSPLLNMGSGTITLRTKRQPYMHANILQPLIERGVEVINVDLKSGEGIDVSGDIYNPEVQLQLRERFPKALLCLNILEHLSDREKFSQVCQDLIPSGGLLFISVPHSFPYHPDPIDTMFRPDPVEVIDLFDMCHPVESEIVQCETFLDQLKRRPKRILSLLIHLLLPYPSFSHWKSSWLKVRWLFRTYKVTCVILRKN